jgi:hypothetical protein
VDYRFCGGARFGCLLLQELGEVGRVDAGVDCGGSIECGDRADGRGLRRREEECLPQRLETPVGSVDPDDDASEYGHASTLRQRPLRLPVILRRSRCSSTRCRGAVDGLARTPD